MNGDRVYIIFNSYLCFTNNWDNVYRRGYRSQTLDDTRRHVR